MLPRVRRQHGSMHTATAMFSCAHVRARARCRACSRVPLQSVLARCACCTAIARPCSRAWTDVPVLTESLCVLHLQVNLARLLNGLGDTSLLHPDSALGKTVHRSEQYDSLMLELRQEKEKNEQLRADLAKRCDPSLQGAIEPVRTELEMQHRDDLQHKLAGQTYEHKLDMQRVREQNDRDREQHDLTLKNLRQDNEKALQNLRQENEKALRDLTQERDKLRQEHDTLVSTHRKARSQITALTQERDALRLRCQRAESWSPPSFTELCSHGKARRR